MSTLSTEHLANEDAEQNILGAVFIDNSALHEVADLLRPEDFRRDSHRLIYRAIVAVQAAGRPMDAITVGDELKRMKALEDVGGRNYLARLSTDVVSAANIRHYAEIVADRAAHRSVVRVLGRGYEDARQPGADADGVASRVVAELLSSTERSAGPVHIGAAIRAAFGAAEAADRDEAGGVGLSTPFSDFDSLTNGLEGSDLIIIAGRPAMGKTSFGLDLVRHVAASGHTVAFFSLEMKARELAVRLLCSEARVSSQNMKQGLLRDHQWAALTKAAQKLYDIPLFVDDEASLAVERLVSRARRLDAICGGLELVVVDYVQLLKASSRGHRDSREQEVGIISRHLKALSKELDIPVVALAQLNRSCESRANKRPMMSDLRESGSLEQDADMICFLYRDEVYNPQTERRGIAELIISKQREGPIGTVNLRFFGQYTCFENLAPGE